MDEEEQLAAVRQDSEFIQYIRNPSERVQLAAVEQDADAIRYISNPSERTQIFVARKYPYAIEHIDNPSPSLFADKEVKQAVITTLISSRFLPIRNDLESYLQYHKVNWPELRNIKSYKYGSNTDVDSQVKNQVMKHIAANIKKGRDITNIVSYLKRLRVEWPELDILEEILKSGVLKRNA